MTAHDDHRAWMPDFSQRSREREWIDDADLSADELVCVLRDLARFNAAMLGHWPVLSWLRRAVRNLPRDTPLTLIDVGCGYGDLLRVIRRWSRRGRRPIRLIGVDISRETIRIAQSATNSDDAIEFYAADVFRYHEAVPADFIVSSLFAHHLSDAMIVDFLRWMETNARRGWFIYDLQRHRVPYLFIGLMGLVTRLHPMVIHDGRISVTRSLTRREWQARLAEAGVGLNAVDLRWFIFRFAIGRLK
ncbi:MAG: methyltransferase domain-containing protein [Pseudolabrys sp.]|nr:methyltransferase domain-containing protein [Pseudolabrys sp.]